MQGGGSVEMEGVDENIEKIMKMHMKKRQILLAKYSDILVL